MKFKRSDGADSHSTQHASGQVAGYRYASMTIITFSLILRMGGTQAANAPVIGRPTPQILPNVQIITVRPAIPVITPAPGVVDSVNTPTDVESDPTPLGITVDSV